MASGAVRAFTCDEVQQQVAAALARHSHTTTTTTHSHTHADTGESHGQGPSSHPQGVNGAKMVLLDVRPFSDYVVGHIQTALSVRLSSLLLRRLGMNKVAIKDILHDEHRAAFAECTALPAAYDIVVYDQATEAVDLAALDPRNALHVVLQHLRVNGFNAGYLQGPAPLPAWPQPREPPSAALLRIAIV